MYAQEMKLPEGKKCAAFISVNLAAEFFWLSLDKKAAEMPKTLSLMVFRGFSACWMSFI